MEGHDGDRRAHARRPHDLLLGQGDQTYTPVNIDCITFREFNTDSVKLADAAFAANGAHHLELGDYGRMLDNEFFVSSGRSMSADLQTWMKNYYNISTAYENLLFGDNLTRKERQVEVSTNGVGLPTSTDGAANTIWANTMTSKAGTALHLINLRIGDRCVDVVGGSLLGTRGLSR